METTELKDFLLEERVSCLSDGFLFTAQSSWVVPGENRLSYTTMVRIVECCREYHWEKDIQARLGDSKLNIDSITKAISGNFYRPILVGQEVKLSYKIEGVRSKGYSLRFKLTDVYSDVEYCEIILVCVFYDPIQLKSVCPPDTVHYFLVGNDNLSI